MDTRNARGVTSALLAFPNSEIEGLGYGGSNLEGGWGIEFRGGMRDKYVVC